jgi:hypothetical protein
VKLCPGKAPIEDLLVIESGSSRNTIDFTDELIHFVLDGLTVLGRIGIIGRLNGQLTHPLQYVIGFLQTTFSSLRKRHTIAGVPNSLIQTSDLSGKPLSDGETSSIITCAVDP